MTVARAIGTPLAAPRSSPTLFRHRSSQPHAATVSRLLRRPCPIPRRYYVYILTNKSHRVLYTGVTNNLVRRVQEHRDHLHPCSFTARYSVHKLVYYECHSYPLSAIDREKRIKGGPRWRKTNLIEGMNPEWRDLFDSLQGPEDLEPPQGH